MSSKKPPPRGYLVRGKPSSYTTARAATQQVIGLKRSVTMSSVYDIRDQGTTDWCTGYAIAGLFGEIICRILEKAEFMFNKKDPHILFNHYLYEMTGNCKQNDTVSFKYINRFLQELDPTHTYNTVFDGSSFKQGADPLLSTLISDCYPNKRKTKAQNRICELIYACRDEISKNVYIELVVSEFNENTTTDEVNAAFAENQMFPSMVSMYSKEVNVLTPGIVSNFDMISKPDSSNVTFTDERDQAIDEFTAKARLIDNKVEAGWYGHSSYGIPFIDPATKLNMIRLFNSYKYGPTVPRTTSYHGAIIPDLFCVHNIKHYPDLITVRITRKPSIVTTPFITTAPSPIHYKSPDSFFTRLLGMFGVGLGITKRKNKNNRTKSANKPKSKLKSKPKKSKTKKNN